MLLLLNITKIYFVL